MTAIEFSQKVKELQPSKELMTTLPIPPDLIDKIYNMYDLTQQEIFSPYPYEIITLIKNFIPTSLPIFGGITLLNKIQEDQDYIYIGGIESDHIVIEKKTHKIKYLEFPNNFVMAKVALNDEAFLDVLFRIYEIFTERILGRDFDSCKVAKELIALSLEPSSVNFYKTLVGCRL